MMNDGRLTSKEVSEALRDNGISIDASKWSSRVHTRAGVVLREAERHKIRKGRPSAVWCSWVGYFVDALHENEHNFCAVFHRAVIL